MATYGIPIEDASDLGNFDLTVDLDGSDYQLVFRFNNREDFWYLDILDAAGNEIRSGLKCVVNWPVLRTCRDQGRPPGELMVLDARPEPEETGLDNLGSIALLTYEEQETLP